MVAKVERQEISISEKQLHTLIAMQKELVFTENLKR